MGLHHKDTQKKIVERVRPFLHPKNTRISQTVYCFGVVNLLNLSRFGQRTAMVKDLPPSPPPPR